MILEFEDERCLLDEQARELMQRCADAAQETEGVNVPLAVFISIVGDDEIQEINREQRGKDASTDVLSFPTVNYPEGKTAGSCEKLLRREYDPEIGACLIGDIVISMDHVGSSSITVTDESKTLSKDASLKELKLSNGTLSPAFSPSTMNYTASVGADISSIVVSGTTSHENAAITSINGADNLKEGQNTVKVSVTAESGATAVYTIIVTKGAAAVATETPVPTAEATAATPLTVSLKFFFVIINRKVNPT